MAKTDSKFHVKRFVYASNVSLVTRPDGTNGEASQKVGGL